MNEVFLIPVTLLVLAWPLGLYLALVYAEQPTRLDRWFGTIEGWLYRGMGVRPEVRMDWQTYALALLRLHLVLGLSAFLILLAQGVLPLNPDGAGGLSWDLALHSAVSFLTNTDQQHYAGQAQLSYLSQVFAILTLQVVTPAAGMAVLVAILRTLFASSEGCALTASGEVSVGHFHVDLVRGIVRVLLPLAFLMALLLAWQGVPSTFDGARLAAPLDATAALDEQRLPVGPVAPLVAIKQLATNGGGWYGPNSAMPFENPTPISNFIETLAIGLLPVSLVVMLGALTTGKRLALSILAVMLTLSIGLSGLAIWSEQQPNPAFAGLAASGPNLEGKEVRIGATATALWAGLTTQISNGSVNGMLESFNPLGGLSALLGMFINAAFGGVGVGLINYLVFLLLAAFLASLMVGRSPEIQGRALEIEEIKLIALTLLLPPLLILGLTALAVSLPGVAATATPGSHGVSQMLYEYSSAVANNGSGFEGLRDDTPWWNLSCALAMLLGRFVPLLAPLVIAARLAAKRAAPTSAASLDLASPTFAFFTLLVILLFTLLSFFPVLVLGPVSEFLGTRP